MRTRSSGATPARRASSPVMMSRVGNRSPGSRAGDASRVMRSGSIPTCLVSTSWISPMSFTQPVSEPPPSYASIPIRRTCCCPMSLPVRDLGGLHDAADEVDVLVDPRIDAAFAARIDPVVDRARGKAGDLANPGAQQDVRRAAAVAVARVEAFAAGDELEIRLIAVLRLILDERLGLLAA